MMNTQKHDMDEQQLEHLVASYGGKIQNIPKEYQVSVQQLLARSETAQQIQQEALALDNLLDTVKVPPPSALLRQRILKAAYRATVPDIWQRLWQWAIGTTPTEYLWRPAVTFLLPLLLGLIIGFQSVQNVSTITLHSQAPVDVVPTTSIEQEIELLGLNSNEFLEWESHEHQ